MKLIKLIIAISTLLFVNLSAATISGFAYCDVNDNGVKDDNETCIQEAIWAKIINQGNGHVSVQGPLYDTDANISGYFEFKIPASKAPSTFRVFLDNNADAKDTVATPAPNTHFSSDPVGDGSDTNLSDGQTTYTITDGNETFEDQNFGMQFGGECNCEDADGTILKRTIEVDGNISDWSDVYTDPDNNVCDYGCALDKDAEVQSTGRNLVQFTWTGDDDTHTTSLYAYGYTFRVGSSTNTQTFIYYADRDGDGVIGDGGDLYDENGIVIGTGPDFALVAGWKGNTGTTTFHFYEYIPADPEGDPMVWTQAEIDAGKLAPGGKIPDSSWVGSGDGYTLNGSLDPASKIEISNGYGNAQGVTVATGGLDDAGVKMEWRVKWAFLNMVPFQNITYHVSAMNSSVNSSNPPGQVDDNMAGCFGEAAIKYCGVEFTPNYTITLPYQPAASVRYFEHNLTNTGNVADEFNLTLVESGSFTPTSVRFFNDLDQSGDETGLGEPVELTSPVAVGLGESINFLVKVELPADLNNTNAILEINASTTACEISHSAKVTDTINVLPQDFDLQVIKKVSDADESLVDATVDTQEGEAVSYTITINNHGPDAATDVVVNDVLPNGVTYVNHIAPVGTDYNASTGQWIIGDMANGASETLVINVTVDSDAGSITGETIQNPACTTDTNDTATEWADCDDANITVTHIPIVNLQITKVVSDPAPYEGDDINYTIIVTNFGPDTAESVEVNDILPSHVTPAGDAEHNASKGTVTGTDWTIGDMLSGDVETLIFKVNVDSNATANNPQTNTVCVTTDTDDTNSSDDCAFSTFNASNIVDVGVVKTVDKPNASAGDTIVYTLNVTNYGPIPVTNLIVQEDLTPWASVTETNATLGTYSEPDWTIPELNVSQTATLTLTATVNSGYVGTFVNVARIDSLDQNDTNGTNNMDGASIIIENPSIDIEKFTNGQDADAAPGPYIPVGNIVSWEYNVSNTGDVNLTGISITDVPAVTITCPATTLEAGESMLCTGSGTAIAGQYENNATVTGTSPIGQDVNDSDPSHYFGETMAIIIEKSTNGQDADAAPGPSVLPGDEVIWTYVVTNNTNVELTDINVTDDQEGLICTALTLAIGASISCETNGTAIVGQYENTSTVTATTPSGATVTDSDLSHYLGDPDCLCENITSDSSPAMNNISAALMMLMTLILGLFFVRREEQFKRNER